MKYGAISADYKMAFYRAARAFAKHLVVRKVENGGHECVEMDPDAPLPSWPDTGTNIPSVTTDFNVMPSPEQMADVAKGG